jgi:hypothetical protein
MTESELHAGLKMLREADARRCAPAEVEERVLNAFREAPRALPRHPWFWGWTAAAAVIALACVTSLISQPEILVQGSASAPIEFYPVTPGEPVESSDISALIRVRLPRSALIGYGLALPPYLPEKVEADLLVGNDGTAYAVRVVNLR